MLVATAVKGTLNTSWTRHSASQEVLQGRRCLPQAADTDRSCLRCVEVCVRRAPLLWLSAVCNPQPSQCCRGHTVHPGPLNPRHFTENHMMQPAETGGLQAPTAQIHMVLQPSSLCHGFSTRLKSACKAQWRDSQRGWLQTWLSPALLNKTSSCCLEQCVFTTTRHLVKKESQAQSTQTSKLPPSLQPQIFLVRFRLFANECWKKPLLWFGLCLFAAPNQQKVFLGSEHEGLQGNDIGLQ